MYNIYNKRLLVSLKCDFKIYSNNDVNIISKMKGDYKDLQIPQAMLLGTQHVIIKENELTHRYYVLRLRTTLLAFVWPFSLNFK